MSGLVFYCCDERRRAQLRAGGDRPNGIDFLEVADLSPAKADAQRLLRVVFVRPASAELQAAIGPENVGVLGGDRVKDVRATAVSWSGGQELRVTVDKAGDFTTYTLTLARHDGKPLEGMDPLLSSVDFSFKAACPADSDCEPQRDCAPAPGEAPEIDYLAKDYASFRQLMLDRMSLVLPEWRERNPADLGVALVELLAYVGDYLSYRQDAVATEAYLGTARRRVSVRRHARLLDYPMHDGCNARVWVHVDVRSRSQAVYDPDDDTADDAADLIALPEGTQLLTRLPGRAPVLVANTAELDRAMTDAPEVFETMHALQARPTHNRIRFYSWGERDCCLPRGATRATLAGHYPHLAPGDVLVFEEVFGPHTGAPGDADPARRHAVRLTEASAFAPRGPGDSGPTLPLEDPAYRRIAVRAAGVELHERGVPALLRNPAVGESFDLGGPWTPEDAGGGRRRWQVDDGAGNAYDLVAAPAQVRVYSPRVTAVAWALEDALPFALCVSATTDPGHGARQVPDVSVARANVLLADHGRTIPAEGLGEPALPDPVLAPAGTDDCGCGCAGGGEEHTAPPPRFRPRLREAPVTQAARILRPPGSRDDDQAPLFDETAAASGAFAWDMARVLPVVQVTDARGSPWLPQRDLLGSDAFAREFVVEVEDDGRANLRFGDDRYGQRPAEEVGLAATYRVGNGTRGNVGADSITHAVAADPGLETLFSVRNPLPARGGTEPESTENVRQVAPAAFRTPERAVTPDDYARMAERHPQVQRAQATVRWTGSWRTLFLTVDRAGGLPVDAPFERDLRRFLERYRLAGHDLEVDEPRWVPVEVEVFTCVDPGYFRADVERALRVVLGNRQLPDGRRGLFHPDNFTFGQSVYLSRVYAAAQGVAGVSWAEVRVFRRQDDPASNGIPTGEIPVKRLEVARLDDDPSHPDRGTLRLSLKGGR
jgi:hypothetical protein